MAKYNQKTEPVVKKTTTLQGGSGFTQKPKHELVGILSTGIQNTYYEKESEREKRLKELIDTIAKKDVVFAAKALIYARAVFGQRTVSHLGSVNLLPHLSGNSIGFLRITGGALRLCLLKTFFIAISFFNSILSSGPLFPYSRSISALSMSS